MKKLIEFTLVCGWVCSPYITSFYRMSLPLSVPSFLQCLLCKTSFQPRDTVVKVCQPCATCSNSWLDRWEANNSRAVIEQQVDAMLARSSPRKRSRRAFESQYADAD